MAPAFVNSRRTVAQLLCRSLSTWTNAAGLFATSSRRKNADNVSSNHPVTSSTLDGVDGCVPPRSNRVVDQSSRPSVVGCGRPTNESKPTTPRAGTFGCLAISEMLSPLKTPNSSHRPSEIKGMLSITHCSVNQRDSAPSFLWHLLAAAKAGICNSSHCLYFAGSSLRLSDEEGEGHVEITSSSNSSGTALLRQDVRMLLWPCLWHSMARRAARLWSTFW